MGSVTDAEYHLAFGLHSGVPLCCAIEFSDGGKGGPCPPCKEKGVVSKEMFSKMHSCHEDNPACVPYLELLERRVFNWFVEYRTDKTTNLVKGKQDDYTWGASLYKPMGGYFRDALKHHSYRLVHLCWPEPSVYWYIFQQEGGKKGTCGICSTRFSLGFPTAGKSNG